VISRRAFLAGLSLLLARPPSPKALYPSASLYPSRTLYPKG